MNGGEGPDPRGQVDAGEGVEGGFDSLTEGVARGEPEGAVAEAGLIGMGCRVDWNQASLEPDGASPGPGKPERGAGAGAVELADDPGAATGDEPVGFVEGSPSWQRAPETAVTLECQAVAACGRVVDEPDADGFGIDGEMRFRGIIRARVPGWPGFEEFHLDGIRDLVRRQAVEWRSRIPARAGHG